ncbi:unnamed protein product [Hyaloperonospora brassicae]|uniref:Uncharacterized protein n=1 Tax=Hyaloperonospora brassicae TaxID=162125 RepID=A0AAV0UNF3_HYABA|nr:unnamed protein product [Hyaloperonospora brassicae]
MGATETLRILEQPYPDLRHDLNGVVDAVVGDDELAADVEVTDDVVNTTADNGDNLIDEEKPVKERKGSDEAPDTPHDTAKTFITAEVLDT